MTAGLFVLVVLPSGVFVLPGRVVGALVFCAATFVFPDASVAAVVGFNGVCR